MESSKKYLQNFTGRFKSLSFKDEPTQNNLKLLADKIVEFTDIQTKKEKEGVSYLVKKGGNYYQFLTTSLSLIEKLMNFEEGSIVNIKVKKIKMLGEVFKTSYEVEFVKFEPLDDEEKGKVEEFLSR